MAENTNTSNKTPMSPLTPYAAAQVINKILELKGIDRKIPPQQMYSAAKNGTIPSNYSTRADKEKVYFEAEPLAAYIKDFVARIERGDAVAGKQDYDKLAEQFMS
jgi:hypothetical protein